MNGIPLLTVRGSHGEMGYAYGQQMANQVAENVELYRRRFRDDASLTEAEVRDWGSTYRDVGRRYDPRIADMLDGLAEGAGCAAAHVYALNARTELLYGGAHRRDEGCTSLAVLPGHTAAGHTLLAQNWDWHPEQGPVTFLLGTTDETGRQVLCLTEAGMLAKCGLSSDGIGLCANLLVSDLDRGGEGVPYHFLLRGVLEGRTMSEAISAAVDCTRISSGNLLLADAGGEAIDLEVHPGDFGYLLPSGGTLTHANHFEAAAVGDLYKARAAMTLLRPTRVRRRLEDALAGRRVQIADIEDALSDHYSFPDSVCRHPNPDTPEHQRVCSVYSLVMDLDAQVLRIRPHPVCEHDAAEVSVAALAGRDGKDILTATLRAPEG